MAGVWRDPPAGREAVLTLEQLQAWIAHASYHARLAVAIGALAPKLRLRNILDLEWGRNVDDELRWITVHKHKTARRLGRPHVVPISEQLREILLDALKRQDGQSTSLIQFRGRPVRSIRSAIRAAARSAGLPYGLQVDQGITFHSLRHTAATQLAELDVSEQKRKELMGHSSLQTTQRYTHLKPRHLIEPIEQLSAAVPIADLVTAPHTRAKRDKAAGTSAGSPLRTAADSRRESPTPANAPTSTKVH